MPEKVADTNRSIPRRSSDAFVLPAEQRDELRSAIRTLGLNQKGLGDLSGVSQAWISNLLTGARPVRDMSLASRLADTLTTREEELLASGRLAPEAASNIESTLHAILARQEAQQRGLIASLSGMIPSDALNYVSRRENFGFGIEDPFAFPARHPFFITGSSQSGLTTEAIAIAEKARDLNIAPIQVDLAIVAPLPKTDNPHDDVAKQRQSLYRELSTEIAYTLGIKDPETTPQGPIFANWLKRTLEAPKRGGQRLLILDDMSALHPKVAQELAHTLSLFSRNFAHSGRKDEFFNVVTTHSMRSRDHLPVAHSLYRYGQEIALPWFGKENVGQLLKVFGGDPSLAQAIYEQYGGQPSLTHVAAREIAYGSPKGAESFFAERATKTPMIDRHVRQIEAMLLYEGKPTSELSLFCFIASASGTGAKYQLKDGADNALDFLLAAHLVIPETEKANQYKPASKFYTSLANDFTDRFRTR